MEYVPSGSPQKGVMTREIHGNEGSTKRRRRIMIRISDEDHTTLHLFRSRLNAHKDIEYCNYFSGHPDLDDPEIYIRANKGKDPVKILKSVVKEASKDFSSLSMTVR